MKMKKYIPIAALAIIFAACSNNGLLPDVDAMTNQPITVSAGVAELVSRGGMMADDLTTLGLTVSNPVKSQYTYTNVKYVRNGSAFTLASDIQPLWQNSTQEVTVSAWSPYVDGDLSGGYAFCVQADQTTDEAAKASDFLWARETVDPDGSQTDKKITCTEEGLLNIALQHAMSKLVVNIKHDTGQEQATIANVAVKKLENACLIDLAGGTIQTPTVAVKKDILAHKEATVPVGYNATYEAIFPPQKAAFDIMIELSDGRKFLYENGEFDFKTDCAYTISLVMGNN